MMPLEIRAGLRKLEFQGARPTADDEEIERVLVEFVHARRLEPDQTVCISLGVRDGVVRQLVGHPTLLQEQSGKAGTEYYYRLHGEVARTSRHR